MKRLFAIILLCSALMFLVFAALGAGQLHASAVVDPKAREYVGLLFLSAALCATGSLLLLVRTGFAGPGPLFDRRELRKAARS